MTLGEKIISLRKQRGLSQEELAITLGVSRQAVSKWETGDATPDTDKVIALTDYFDVTTDWLLRDIEPPAEQADGGAAVPALSDMLRSAPMLLDLTTGGCVFGAALLLFDWWQQTYYCIPTILGLLIQIGMCALFLGLCSSIGSQDAAKGLALRARFWRRNIFPLALMPCMWAAWMILWLAAQRFAVSVLLQFPLALALYLFVCLRIQLRTRGGKG